MRKTTVAAVGAALTLLAACSSNTSSSQGGSGSGGGAAAGEKDPCSVLTDKQVQNAIGLPPKSHTPNLQLKPIVDCKWETNSDLFGVSVAFGPKDKYPMD